MVVWAGCLPAPVGDTGAAGDGDGGSGMGLAGHFAHEPDLHIGASEATVGLLPITEGAGQPELGAPAWTTQISGIGEGDIDFEIVLPVPGDGDYFELFPGDGMEVAAYMLGAWLDQDGDGEPGDADVMVGAQLTLLVHIRGDLGASVAHTEAEPGWNLMEMGWWDGVGVLGAKPLGAGQEIELRSNLFFPQRESLAVHVDIVGVDTVTVESLAGICGTVPSAASPYLATARNSGEAVSFPWAQIGNDPPLDHYDNDLAMACGDSHAGLMDVDVAIYNVVGWHDTNQDGERQGLDTVFCQSASSGGEQSVVVFMRPAGFMAASYEQLGGGMGWQRLGIGGVGTAEFLSWETGVSCE